MPRASRARAKATLVLVIVYACAVGARADTAKTLCVTNRRVCAVQADGGLKCWGINNYGQGGQAHNYIPGNWLPYATSVIGINGSSDATTAVGVTCGSLHTCALMKTGAAKCWGLGSQRQIGNGEAPQPPNYSQIDDTFVLSIDGATDATRAVSLGAGDTHTCAAMLDGTVKCWGSNFKSELTGGYTGARDPTAVYSGNVGAGEAAPDTAVAVAIGFRVSLALLEDGTVKCWGYNTFGQCGTPLPPNNIVTHGMNQGGDIGVRNPSFVQDVAGGNLQGVKLLVTGAGSRHACAALETGAAMCWGKNDKGQLGSPTVDLDMSHAAVAVPGVSHVSSMCVGNAHTCATMSGGGVKCWGQNTYGQLGNNSTLDSHVPVDVIGIKSAVDIACGWQTTCAHLVDGSMSCWGGNDQSQFSNGRGAAYASSTPVAIPSSVAMAQGPECTSCQTEAKARGFNALCDATL
jgi:alpha-tubulin suppressor-like RCC1 family protein